MAIKKIPCGGFSYDDTEISFEDGVIHPIGGGDESDLVVQIIGDFIESVPTHDGVSVISGSVQNVITKLQNNETPNVLIKYVGVENDSIAVIRDMTMAEWTDFIELTYNFWFTTDRGYGCYLALKLDGTPREFDQYYIDSSATASEWMDY